MRFLLLHHFAENFVVGVVTMRFSFMQAFRLSSVDLERRLVLMLFRCEKDCSHVYVEPNIVRRKIAISLNVEISLG